MKKTSRSKTVTKDTKKSKHVRIKSLKNTEEDQSNKKSRDSKNKENKKKGIGRFNLKIVGSQTFANLKKNTIPSKPNKKETDKKEPKDDVEIIRESQSYDNEVKQEEAVEILDSNSKEKNQENSKKEELSERESRVDKIVEEMQVIFRKFDEMQKDKESTSSESSQLDRKQYEYYEACNKVTEEIEKKWESLVRDHQESQIIPYLIEKISKKSNQFKEILNVMKDFQRTEKS